jgi:DNA-binding beta-propeller fold protein YncE
VYEFNTLDNSISRSGLGWFVDPQASAITPDGKLLFMAGWKYGNNAVYGLDTETYKITTNVFVLGNDQRGLVISKDSTTMYVADNYYKTVTVVDLKTKLPINIIPLGAHPEQIALSPDNSRLYVSANTPGAFIVIDTSTNSIINSIPTSGNLGGVYASPDGKKVFVADRLGKKILVYNAANLNLITSMPIASSSSAYLIGNHAGTKLYVLSYKSKNISIFDTQTLTLIKKIELLTIQHSAALIRDGVHMYVVGGNLVYVLDTTTDTVIKTTPVNGIARTVTAMPVKLVDSNLLVQNGGFNGYPTLESMIPRYWVATGFAATDGKFTAFKKEGTASVKIEGAAGATKILYQTFTYDDGKIGDELTFAYWARGNSIPKTDGFCRGQIFLYTAEGGLVTAQTVDCSTGNYATFEKKSVVFTAPTSYKKIVVKFMYSKPTGAIIFDQVSLLIK